jgi:hypothetical protein
LTDSIKEEIAVERESLLPEMTREPLLLIEGTCTARIRGGARPMALGDVPEMHVPSSRDVVNTSVLATADGHTSGDLETYRKSSWVQSLFEILYKDVMSAYAVNTFVPLLLCREILPLMGCSDPTTVPSRTQPQAYNVNVSSR